MTDRADAREHAGNSMRRVVLTTGGTGGHVFPALAVAEVLTDWGVDCLFVGSEYGREAEWVKQAGLEFVGLPVRGVLGRGIRAVGALGSMAVSVFKGRKLLGDFRPDAVAGFGGYASCAALTAAWMRDVPVLVHEQNSFPGLTNRLMGRIADRVCLSMPGFSGVGFDAGGAFPKAKCIWTGNPVRRAFLEAARRADPVTDGPHAPRLLVVGGSLGAKALNTLVLAGLPRLMEAGVEIRHQTGRLDYERVIAGYRAHGLETNRVTPFIGDMPEAYAWADLVLCRAGASTVAELAVCGKPAVFIPFPYATHDHQAYNAKVVCHGGAAMMFTEREVSLKDVLGSILMLLRDRDQLGMMSKAALAQARPDAAESVAREIMSMITGLEPAPGRSEAPGEGYKRFGKDYRIG